MLSSTASDNHPLKQVGESLLPVHQHHERRHSQPGALPGILHHDALLALFIHIAEDSAQDLPGRALGDLVDDLDLGDPFVADLLVLDILDQALGSLLDISGLAGLGLQHDVRLGPLAGVVVGDAEDGDVLDVRVAEQQVFELRGRDADALHLDHLLQPVRDGDEALFVQRPDVACVQEPVAVERLVRRLLVVQVPHDDLRAARPDLAGLVQPAFLACVGVDDLDFG